MAQVETKTVEADESGMRLDRWFKHHYPDLSFGHLQKLLRSGQVRVNGGRARTNTRLDTGQAVRVPPLNAPAPPVAPTGPGGKPGRVAGAAAELRSMILYEDDAVMVLNKPAGLAVQGGPGVRDHVDAMLQSLRVADGQKARLVHRLDKDTSGVLVVAKTRLASAALAASFRGRSAKKIYWALVAGVPKPRSGRVSTWLAKDRGEGENMVVAGHGDEDASHAVSFYTVIDKAGPSLAWLAMRPVTGRTHQLRAHAAHIGHPIVGDPRYFHLKDWQLPGGIQNRMHLHARRIVIPHPDGGVIDVSAPLPPHMVQSWNLLGFDVAAGAAIADESFEA